MYICIHVYIYIYIRYYRNTELDVNNKRHIGIGKENSGQPTYQTKQEIRL